MATVNEALRDFSVARQIQVLRASRRETASLLRLYARADDEISARLLRIRDPSSVTGRRLLALRDAIRAALERQHEAVRAGLNPFLDDLAAAEAEAAAGALARPLVPIGLDVATPRSSAVVAAMRSRPFEGALLREWIQRLERSDVERTWGTILRGITIGDSTEEIVRATVGTRALRFKDGQREVSRRGVRVLVRTAAIHAATAGREAAWQDNADLLLGELYVSTLDGRTTPICQSLDGEVFPVGEGPMPPVHIQCRSTRTPVVKGAAELGAGTRASLDGQVPEDLTYEDWLRRRSAAFQDEVLGPTKGKLFRDGGLSLDRFVNDAGQPMTVADLRRSAPAAFDEAGL